MKEAAEYTVCYDVADDRERGHVDGAAQAEQLATQRAADVTSKLAALHEPDMAAGGWLKPQVNRMGRSDVNQSIGGGWNQSRTAGHHGHRGAGGDPHRRRGREDECQT